MVSRRLLPSTLLSFLLAAPPLAANAAPIRLPKPAAKPAVKPRVIAPSVVPPNVLLKERPIAPSPELSRLMLTSLRRFVEGAKDPTEVDRAITKALGRNRNAKKTAKQLLARIDTRPPAALEKVFGKSAPTGGTTKQQLSEATAHAGMRFAGVGITPVGSLPDEAVTAPTKFQLEISGLKAVELSDGDADGDELLAMTALVAGNYSMAIASAPATGVLDGVTATTPMPLDIPFYNGQEQQELLVSLVAEIDGDATTTRDDFAVVLALAQAHAKLLADPGDNTATALTRFAMTLDYTVALLNVADPERFPAGCLQKTMLSGPTSLNSLYATPASTDGAVPWKITHDHDLPSGHYKLYYNVPSPDRPRPRLKVAVTKVEALDPEPGGADLGIIVAIDDASAEKALPNDKNVDAISWVVQRKLSPDPSTATVTMWVFDRERPVNNKTAWVGDRCGDWGAEGQYPPCPIERRFLDASLAPVVDAGSFGYDDGRTLSLTIDLESGAITGDATGQLGQAMTTAGADPGVRARTTFTITLEP